MDRIIGLGNALIDILARMNSDELLHQLNLPKGSMQLITSEKRAEIATHFETMSVTTTTGGSAANTILALASLGAQTGFVGKVGIDAMGDFYEQTFKKQGIAAHLLRSNLPSGVASTFISPDGERTFGTYLGAAAELTPADLSAELFVGYTHLYIEGYLVQNHELILHAVQLASKAGLLICLDLASYNVVEGDLPLFTQLIADHVDIVFANEEEARAFTGKEPEEALEIMAAQCTIAVVKLGAAGSIIQKGRERVAIQSAPIDELVDTNAAGDFFAAGFLYGLMAGYTLQQCGEIGSVLAGKIIQTVGTKLPQTTWDQINTEIKRIGNKNG